jgi:predicted  nucleic acid-binding Zn-ribbon protein
MTRIQEVFVKDVSYHAKVVDGVAVVTATPAVYVTNRMNAEGSDLRSKIADLESKLAQEERSAETIRGALDQVDERRRMRDETPADAPSIREGYEREIETLEENLVGHDEWLAHVESRILSLRGEIRGLSARYESLAAMEVPAVRVWRVGLENLEIGVRG